MFGRHFLFIFILLGAAVIPYLANNTSGKLFGKGGDAKEPEPVAGNPASLNPRTVSANKPVLNPEQPITGGPVQDLAEVLRFDISPQWVMQRWPRVSAATSTTEPIMQGYRVPVVTGTRPDDIAGSLTYYFTDHQRVRRIAFQGTTGDPRRLIELVSTKYELQPQTPEQPGDILYQVRWNNLPQSEMLIKPDRVFHADTVYGRYDVTLEINNFAAK